MKYDFTYCPLCMVPFCTVTYKNSDGRFWCDNKECKDKNISPCVKNLEIKDQFFIRVTKSNYEYFLYKVINDKQYYVNSIPNRTSIIISSIYDDSLIEKFYISFIPIEKIDDLENQINLRKLFQ